MLTISSWMLGVSLLSILGDTYVAITFWLLESIRHKIYIKLVFLIALSDLVAAIGTSIGLQSSGSGGCVFQAATSTAFHLAAVYWTVMLTQVLYGIVMRGQATKIKLLSQGSTVVYLVCIFLSLLPLTTNSIGRWSENLPGRCFISNSGSVVADRLWMIFTFYLWIWAAIVLITVSFFKMFAHTKDFLGDERARALKSLVYRQFDKCWPYPLLVLLCWSVPTVVDFYSTAVTANETVDNTVARVGLLLPILHGFMNAVVFYSCNKKMLNTEWGKRLSKIRWIMNGRKIVVVDAYALVWDIFRTRRERVPEEAVEFSVFDDPIPFDIESRVAVRPVEDSVVVSSVSPPPYLSSASFKRTTSTSQMESRTSRLQLSHRNFPFFRSIPAAVLVKGHDESMNYHCNNNERFASDRRMSSVNPACFSVTESSDMR